jgi:thioesterase domain-containing protein/aryl carrier-like protein
LWHTGRSDDLVKIGGKLVSPSEAASVLSTIDGVRRAVVLTRALDSRRIQLIGHVEASEDVDPDGVRRMLADELPAHLIPAVLVRHDQLPLANGGKVDRQRLLSKPMVQWRTAPRAEPRNDLERFVLIEVARMLGLTDLGVDDDLWMFGLDSLGAIELSETLSRAMASNLTVNDFIGASTVAAISKRIAECGPSKASNVVTLVESERKPTVFMMTGAGGPALQYRAIAQGVANGAGVVGLEQWGLMQNCRPDRSVKAAAQRNVQSVYEVSGEGPLVLIGHSWGGLVAHEMAVRLSNLGRSVILVLLDTGRPHSGKRNHNLPLVIRALAHSSSRKSKTLHRSRLYWVVRPRLSWVLRDDRFRRFFWIGVRTAKRHRARIFDGRILVLQAENSTAGLDWQDQPQVQVESTCGNHVSMCHAPHVQSLVDIVNTYITSCLANDSIARD